MRVAAGLARTAIMLKVAQRTSTNSTVAISWCLQLAFSAKELYVLTTMSEYFKVRGREPILAHRTEHDAFWPESKHVNV